MIQGNRCPNFNHSRVNAPVHFCSMCGGVVNENIPVTRCSEEEHAIKRRERSKYCIDCGKQLIHGT